MPVSVSIDISNKVSPALAKLMSALDGEKAAELNEVVARAEVNEFRAYHREFQTSRGWENPSLPTHGPGRKSSRFGESVSRAWQIGGADRNGFSLTNNATGFAHKVSGGTIRPKKAKALTIPMVPEAHGVRAANYPGRLFRPKGHDVLMEQTEDGEARVVYLLRRSVTHEPWTGALPSMEIVGERVANLLTDLALEELEG